VRGKISNLKRGKNEATRDTSLNKLSRAEEKAECEAEEEEQAEHAHRIL
jgi:hypothetical protein